MARQPSNPTTTGMWRGAPAEFRTDRMMVSLRSTPSDDTVFDAILIQVASELEVTPQLIRRAGRPWAVLTFDPVPDAATRIPAVADSIASRADILYAEPDFIGYAHGAPNDTMYGAQWWAQRIGMESAWGRTTGSLRVLIAILDSGVSMQTGGPQHPDLDISRLITSHKIFITPFPHDYVAPDDYPHDEHGHGTLMTGIVAATPNNNEGVAGANWISRVYVARVLDEFKQQTSVGVIKLAVDDVLRYVEHRSVKTPIWLGRPRGPRLVVNLSLGFKRDSDAFDQMCRETDGGNVVICVSADRRPVFLGDLQFGLSNTDVDYPAAYADRYDHVIAVGATNEAEMVVGPLLSNVHGPVTICAPGTSIRSTVPNHRCTMHNYAGGRVPPYQDTAGTSPACAIVSGVASLVWSHNRNLPAAALKAILVDTADWFPGPGGAFPRVNAGEAVRAARRPWLWATVWLEYLRSLTRMLRVRPP